MKVKPYSYDFTGGDLPVELGRSFWLDGGSLSRTSSTRFLPDQQTYWMS